MPLTCTVESLDGFYALLVIYCPSPVLQWWAITRDQAALAVRDRTIYPVLARWCKVSASLDGGLPLLCAQS